MVNANNLYISYDVSGMQVCVTAASTADDIKLSVVEIVPQKSHSIVATVELTRIPSEFRAINSQRVAEDYYGMTNVMLNEREGNCDIIAQEMELMDPEMTLPYMQKLQENDLYIIKSIHVTKNRRNEGIGSCVLQQLPQVLKRITNDQNPVIAVIPSVKVTGTLDKVKNFFTKNGYKKVHTCAQTLYFC